MSSDALQRARDAITHLLAGHDLAADAAANIAAEVAALFAPLVHGDADAIIAPLPPSLAPSAAHTLSLRPPGPHDLKAGSPGPAPAPAGEEGALLQRLSPHPERYCELGEIGRGGMGRVLAVVDRDFRRQVAMKVLPLEDSSADKATRFLREARITGQLEHPAVVPAYDMGINRSNGRSELFYTMKRVTGRSLAALAREHHEQARGGDPARVALGLRRLVRIVQRVCQAVDYAHERGVLHRDLKPQNVMVGDYGEAYLVDWGLATKRGEADSGSADVASETSEAAVVSRLVGTPAYLPLEVARGEAPDERSDVYGLGAILFQILYGTAPHHGDTVADVLAAAASDEAQAPAEHAGAVVPPELAAICRQAMARNPSQRTASARALHAELEEYLEGVKERERRGQEARRLAAEGVQHTRAYVAHREAFRELEAQSRALERTFKGPEPIAEKSRWWALEDRAEAERRALGVRFAAAERSFHNALEFEPQCAPARRGLADLYYDRFRAAEVAREEHEMLYYRELVEIHHEGKYDHELRGDGELQVMTSPSDAEVYIYAYEQRERRLVPVPWKRSRAASAKAEGEDLEV
ncbi:MAG: serine/threonine protein kinase [Candidatus Schekmanbacteria bacterium]|nr:serine/threonine protein kinase [Candidatus Schekmanbacteria bacterium]